MRRFKCSQCGMPILIPDDYLQPFIKCQECGSHEIISAALVRAPKYKVLDDQTRIHIKMGIKSPPISEIEEHEDVPAEPSSGPKVPKIPPPAIIPKKSATGWSAKPVEYRNIKKQIDTRKILIDALGKEGLEMVFALVASYLLETDESRKRFKKTKVVQTLMKSKITAELATLAVAYAEKCPETKDFLWTSYKSNLQLGLGIFAIGAIISTLIHFLAHPGRGFTLFQLPFAVGFAYAINAGINLASIKFECLRSEKIHYLVMGIISALIAVYVVWGIYF